MLVALGRADFVRYPLDATARPAERQMNRLMYRLGQGILVILVMLLGYGLYIYNLGGMK